MMTRFYKFAFATGLMITGCASTIPGADRVRTTENLAEVAHCKAIGEVRSTPPYGLPNEDLVQMKNAAFDMKADVVLITSRSAFSKISIGTAYACMNSGGVTANSSPPNTNELQAEPAGQLRGSSSQVVLVVRPRVSPAEPLVQPDYPWGARATHKQGIVALWVLVGTTGRITNVRVARSSGFPDLDEVAVKNAEKNWRLIPGTLSGHPAEMWAVFTASFGLGGQDQRKATAAVLGEQREAYGKYISQLEQGLPVTTVP